MVRDFFVGFSYMFRGLALYTRSPGVMLLGLLPALVSFGILAAGFVALLTWDGNLTTLLTPYANSWPDGVKTVFRALVEVAVLGAWLLASVLCYTAITLFLGEPEYQVISRRVDELAGGVPGGTIKIPFWKAMPRSALGSARLLLVTVPGGVLAFLIGLIPIAGQIVGPVLYALVGGWAVAIELTGIPFERRRYTGRQARAMLRSRRSASLGFGLAAFLCFLLPGPDILLMPGAVAGATMLVRDLCGDDETRVG
jgi:CysZ protein